MNLTQLAGTLPYSPEFREFLEQFVQPPVTEAEAAQFIRYVCEVESRKELATSRTAEQRFHEYLRKPYAEWRAKNTTHDRRKP